MNFLFNELLKKNIVGILFSIIAGSLSIGFNVALMGLAAYIISRASFHPELYMLMPYITGVRFFGTFRGVLRYVERLYSHHIALNIVAQIRVWFFNKIDQNFSAQDSSINSSMAYSEMINSVNALENITVKVILPVGIAFFIYFAISFFGFVYYNDTKYALLYIIYFFPVIFVIPFLGFYRFTEKGVQLKTHENNFEKYLIHFYSVLPEVNLYSMGELLKENYQKYLKLYDELSLYLKLKNHFYHSVQYFLMHFFIACVFALELFSPGLGTIYLAVWVLVIISGFEIILPVFYAASYFSYYKFSIEKLIKNYDVRNEWKNVVEPLRKFNLNKSEDILLQIKNLSFQYTSKSPSLFSNVHFTVKKKKIYVITGISGSGKSTLMSLLLGEIKPKNNLMKGSIEFYKPQSRLNDNKVVSGVFTPRSYFFEDDLIFNLYMNPSKKKINEKEMNLLKRLKLNPNELNQKGKNLKKTLSFGQRKRILLVRALATSSDIIYLDEPTEGMDFEIRLEINSIIKDMKKESSFLIISHKLEILEIADEIYNLQNGRLVRVK